MKPVEACSARYWLRIPAQPEDDPLSQRRGCSDPIRQPETASCKATESLRISVEYAELLAGTQKASASYLYLANRQSCLY